MFYRILKKSIEEKKIIGIRTYDLEYGEIIIGYIVDLNNTRFIINEVDEYGKYIGSTIILLTDVHHIEYDDRYQQRLQFVLDNNSLFDSNNRLTIWAKKENIIPYLDKIKDEKMLSTFFLNEDDYVYGFLSDISNNYMLIKNIGDEGDEDGLSCYRVEDVIGLRYGSLIEQKIELLYNNKSIFYK